MAVQQEGEMAQLLARAKVKLAAKIVDLPVFAPIHVRLIQISEKGELILAVSDALQGAPPFPNRGLLFVRPIQFQALLHLGDIRSKRCFPAVISPLCTRVQRARARPAEISFNLRNVRRDGRPFSGLARSETGYARPIRVLITNGGSKEKARLII